VSVSPRFDGHLVIQQRVLPGYRVPFFERLAAACDRLTVLAGMPRPDEAISPADGLSIGSWVRLINHHRLSGPFYLCSQPGLMQALDDAAPDALVLEANPRYLSNWPARRWANAKGIPVLGWGLGAGRSGWLSRWVWMRFVDGMDGMIAYSSSGADAYRRLGVPADRLALAVNAAGPAPTERPNRRARPNRPLRVLFVGRLQARKRVDTLLRACSAMARTPDLRIVGDGPARDALAALASDILPEATFDGHLEGRPLDDAFAWADVFVLPGTGGLAVQQAMASALPVIVGEGDGTADDLVRSGNGWRVPPGDAPALAMVLEVADGDRTTLVEMGAESHRIVSEEVNLDTMANAFVNAVTNARRRV
jgi:glycosyltransferase involved in cell wall biosynthesis